MAVTDVDVPGKSPGDMRFVIAPLHPHYQLFSDEREGYVMAMFIVSAGARMVDAMEEPADAQLAKRVCVERKRRNSS